MIPTHSHPRLRDDLVWFPQESNETERWTLHDPASGEFYYFTAVEKDILRLFQGQMSLQQIHHKLLELKPGCDWSVDKLSAFLQLLTGYNLVRSDHYGRGRVLFDQIATKKRRSILGWFLQPLSIRFPLFSPLPLLKWLQPLEALLFAPLTVCVVVFSAILLVFMTAVRWDEISSGLPPIETLLRGDRFVLLVLILILVKSLHEMAHAMACHRYTKSCGEIGVYFLVFTPCLYCDVSPSWRASSRWHRATIALAGVYVELILAILAYVLLMFAESDSIRAIALYVLVICSVGTIFLNGNPLIKYDGYFAMSDLLMIPNLAEQAHEAMTSTLLSWLSQRPVNSAPRDASTCFLVTYWLLSAAYRISLMAVVLWGINVLLRPYGLEWLANYIAFVAVVGLVYRIATWIRLFGQTLQQNGGVRLPNFALILSAVAGLLAFLFFVPLGDAVESRGVVRFAVMQPIFVQQPGNLQTAIEAEGWVRKGETIYVLTSIEQQERELQATYDVEAIEQKTAVRKEIAALNPTDDLQLPTFQRMLETKTKQLETIRAEGEDLVFRAPDTGYWFHALSSWQENHDSPNLLPWTGFPLAQQNRGAYLDKGILLGWLVQRDKPIVEAYVSERDLDRIRVGLRTNVRIDHQTQQTYTGTVTAIGAEPIQHLPAELAGDWQILAQPDSQNRWLPEIPCYRVEIALENPPADLLLGNLGTVRIETNSLPLAYRLYRILKQTIFYQRQSS